MIWIDLYECFLSYPFDIEPTERVLQHPINLLLNKVGGTIEEAKAVYSQYCNYE